MTFHCANKRVSKGITNCSESLETSVSALHEHLQRCCHAESYKGALWQLLQQRKCEKPAPSFQKFYKETLKCSHCTCSYVNKQQVKHIEGKKLQSQTVRISASIWIYVEMLQHEMCSRSDLATQHTAFTHTPEFSQPANTMNSSLKSKKQLWVWFLAQLKEIQTKWTFSYLQSNLHAGWSTYRICCFGLFVFFKEGHWLWNMEKKYIIVPNYFCFCRKAYLMWKRWNSPPKSRNL